MRPPLILSLLEKAELQGAFEYPLTTYSPILRNFCKTTSSSSIACPSRRLEIFPFWRSYDFSCFVRGRSTDHAFLRALLKSQSIAILLLPRWRRALNASVSLPRTFDGNDGRKRLLEKIPGHPEAYSRALARKDQDKPRLIHKSPKLRGTWNIVLLGRKYESTMNPPLNYP